MVDVIKANAQSLKSLKFQFYFTNNELIKKVILKRIIQRGLATQDTKLEHITIHDHSSSIYYPNLIFEELNKLAIKQGNILKVTLFKQSGDLQVAENLMKCVKAQYQKLSLCYVDDLDQFMLM